MIEWLTLDLGKTSFRLSSFDHASDHFDSADGDAKHDFCKLMILLNWRWGAPEDPIVQSRSRKEALMMANELQFAWGALEDVPKI